MAKSELLTADLFIPTEDQAEYIRQLAALGYSPAQMSAALKLDRVESLMFQRDAATPGTSVAALIRQGVIETAALPQMSLQSAASKGDVDAFAELQKALRRNQFTNLLDQMDDDELTIYQ